MRKIILSILLVLCAWPASAWVISDQNDQSLPYHSPGSPNNTAYLHIRPGEYAVVAEVTVPESSYALVPNPECSNQDTVVNAIGALKDAAANFKDGKFTAAINDILGIDEIYSSLKNVVGDKQAAEIDALFGGDKGRKAAVCSPISVYLQPGATMTGYSVMAMNPDGIWLKCAFGGDERCGKAWMSFPGPSYIKNGTVNTGQVVSVIFKNWKHDWKRHARFVVFFTLPENEVIVEPR